MKFQFSEKKVKLPEKVHAYAEKKVMKLARYFEEDAEALIVFSVEKNRNKAELTVHGGAVFYQNDLCKMSVNRKKCYCVFVQLVV